MTVRDGLNGLASMRLKPKIGVPIKHENQDYGLQLLPKLFQNVYGKLAGMTVH